MTAKNVLLGVQRGEAAVGVADDVSCPRAVHPDPKAVIITSTPEISRIDQCAAGAQLGGEGISAATVCVLFGVQRGEASRGVARDVICARAVDCNCTRLVILGPSQLCRLHQNAVVS